MRIQVALAGAVLALAACSSAHPSLKPAHHSTPQVTHLLPEPLSPVIQVVPGKAEKVPVAEPLPGPTTTRPGTAWAPELGCRFSARDTS